MRYLIYIFLVLFLCLSCSKERSVEIKENIKAEQNEDVYKKEAEALERQLKKDIRIKVKRDGKGNYSWEITGKDVNEIIRINEILKKRLSE